MGFNRHTDPPPPPPNFKDCFKCKGKKGIKKEKKYMKVRDEGGGVIPSLYCRSEGGF